MIKPRFRVRAGDAFGHSAMLSSRARTADSFANFAARTGIGTGNLTDAGGYDFNFITRQRTGLEAAYRGSWIIGAAVDHAADDMTSGGIDFGGDVKPEDVEAMQAGMRDLQIWQQLGHTIRWGRLYGSAVALMLIDGQDMATPLDLDTIKPGQFKGLYVMDRWMLNPTMSETIQELGPSLGQPKFYDVMQNSQIVDGRWRIHHTRLVRFDGVKLPYQQWLTENMWGMSIIERIFDRVQAFDSTTAGVAQLVFKSYLRTWKIKELRSLIASGGPMLEGVIKQIDFVRQYQSNEGITVIDAEDEFETQEYTFGGLDAVLEQFSQQVAGAIEEPIVRLFGQSPGGLNSTGESDLRTYYDVNKKRQETHLRQPLTLVLDVLARSVLGRPLDKGFTFEFRSLWKPTEEQKADIGNKTTQSVVGAYEAGVVERSVALKELKANSDVTGLWANISDEDIAEAEEDPPIGEHLDNELNPPEPDMPVGGNVAPIKKDAA